MKVCIRCRENKPETQEYFHKHKNGLRSTCKACRKIEWTKPTTNIKQTCPCCDKIFYYIAFTGKQKYCSIVCRRKFLRSRLLAKRPKHESDYQKKAVKELSDNYIKTLLVHHGKLKGVLRPDSIPKELIELKRLEIQLTRKLKEYDNSKRTNGTSV